MGDELEKIGQTVIEDLICNACLHCGTFHTVL